MIEQEIKEDTMQAELPMLPDMVCLDEKVELTEETGKTTILDKAEKLLEDGHKLVLDVEAGPRTYAAHHVLVVEGYHFIWYVTYSKHYNQRRMLMDYDWQRFKGRLYNFMRLKYWKIEYNKK